MPKSEPAAIGTAIAAAINALVLFALDASLTLDQQAAIVTVVTLIAGVMIRSRVNPVA